MCAFRNITVAMVCKNVQFKEIHCIVCLPILHHPGTITWLSRAIPRFHALYYEGERVLGN